MKQIFVFFLATILAGCATSSATFSNTFIKPQQPIAEMRVLYIENELTSSENGKPNPEAGVPPNIITVTGYKDLPELLRERVPKVFNLNNINTEYETFKRQNFGRDEQIQAVKWSASAGSYPALLIIEVAGISETWGQRMPRTDFVDVHANLFGLQGNTRIWTGQFTSKFIQPPAGYNGFDNKSADRLLKTVLEQMDRDGIIRLPAGKAVLPENEHKGNSSAKRE